ncbi:MAG: hypothetical protein LQ342_004643 [Letrouitia transgressa]|nr:MAG: hypothetical protein LQ342_004643 [Letrouitia transgressa]
MRQPSKSPYEKMFSGGCLSPELQPHPAQKSLQKLLDHAHQQKALPAMDPMAVTRKSLPESLPIQVSKVLPRYKEGGVFVKFSHDPAVPATEIETTLQVYLRDHPIRPWFSPFRRVRSFLVQGRPWLEDLHRFPSSKLKVEFVPLGPGSETPDLSEETLYGLFRKYGKMGDITPQPAGSKDLPRYAVLHFSRIRHAIMAKNCMHRYIVSESEGGAETETLIKIMYEQRIKAHVVRDWIFNHPRIVIPLIAAFLATFTVAVFDPIRTFFIKSHITHNFHITDNKAYKWLRSQATRANDLLRLKRHKTEDASLSTIWDDRKSAIEKIQNWLMETADTFIVIQGPRGSGKMELVLDQSLKGRGNNLVIDCKPIQEARGDSATIGAAAAEVGYRPVFSWMNSISSLIDLAAQGTIGTKTGFSETLDTQLAKIWQNTTNALKAIALDGRSNDDKDSELGDDEYLEAHPERRPVVIINNFLHKSQESSVVYDKISEWAAGLTTANIAHVIFLTNDVSFSKSLSKALPDRVFREISLGDCTPEVAKRFVINHLDADSIDVAKDEKRLLPSQSRQDLSELDSCIDILGGRLTDLEFLARRIKTGESPNKAVHEIIQQSASEILKMYILDVDRSARKWTPEQAWVLIKSLAAHPTLRYNELLLSDTYKSGGKSVLQALEQAELISILSSNGRPHSIHPGKPVYRAAFKQLTEDKVLRASLDLKGLGELIKMENQGIEKAEAELALLGSLPGQGKEVQDRVKWLLGKMAKAQGNIERYERESGNLKKVLERDY